MSRNIVPGDVVFVKENGFRLPFDGVVLEGEMLVN